MQKWIFLILVVLIAPMCAMETQTPRQLIIGEVNINTTGPFSFVTKLAQTHPNIPLIQLSQEDILSHQSPLITAIHSQKYLNNIEKHPSIMLSAITNTLLTSLYPNRYSRTYFDPMLRHCATTVVATKLLIAQYREQQDNAKFPLNYTISLGEGYSFAGHAQGNHDHAYASIPIAAAHALNTTKIKRILIIDESLNKGPIAVNDYYQHGNGSIFYAKDNPRLADFFDGKIIMHDKIPGNNLWNFLENPDHGIDLAFYNINLENPDTKNTSKPYNIFFLFQKFIPTIFILSGNKDIHKDTACSIIDCIVETAKAITTLSLSLLYSPQKSSIQSKLHTSSSSSSSDDYNDIFAFKVTTDLNATCTYDGANYIYLANNITISNDGVMKIELDEDYAAYGGYNYHSPTSRSSDSDYVSFDSENSETFSEYSEQDIEEEL